MAVKVTVPNKNYNTKFQGVTFSNGVGIFEDEALGEMIAKDLGYQVEKVVEAKVNKEPAPAKKASAKKASTKKQTKKVAE